MTEVFANKIATTLASPYVAASGTLVVASDTGLPATGTFRLRLGNLAGTILRVDSRVGTTLTVTVEQDDGNADAGDTVTLVVTAGAMNQLKADAIAGSGGGSGLPWWPTGLTPIVTGDYAWVNQGTTVLDDTHGFTRLLLPSASTSIRARVKTAPATPYVIEAVVWVREVSASKYAGLCFRESGTGELTIAYVLPTNNLLNVINFTDPTTFSASAASGTILGSLIGSFVPIFVRIRDDGTNLFFAASRQGFYYDDFAELSIARTSFMAGGPDQVGFFANVDSAAGVFATDFYDWRES